MRWRDNNVIEGDQRNYAYGSLYFCNINKPHPSMEIYVIAFFLNDIRSLADVDKWKMREYHTFFMYYAYNMLQPFEGRIPLAPKLLKAMKHLLLALHFTKGFYDEVLITLFESNTGSKKGNDLETALCSACIMHNAAPNSPTCCFAYRLDPPYVHLFILLPPSRIHTCFFFVPPAFISTHISLTTLISHS
jgi:hypothetical protein